MNFMMRLYTKVALKKKEYSRRILSIDKDKKFKHYPNKGRNIAAENTKVDIVTSTVIERGVNE